MPACRRRSAAAPVALSAWMAFVPMGDAHAGVKDQLVGQGGVPQPMQRVVGVERPRGPIFIAVPIAYTFGLGGDKSPAYCSPTIRADNSSNSPVQELIVAIEFKTATGLSAGSTVSEYNNIKIGEQTTHYFYQLTTPNCRGLDGTVSVVRCVYKSGLDCRPDVRAVGFGTVPLRLKPR